MKKRGSNYPPVIDLDGSKSHTDGHELIFMKDAIDLAELSYQESEVPVGAVVVVENEIIGRGHNSMIGSSDPTAHAEMIALRSAGEKIKNYRIIGAEVYVTLEPCLMCYSAMVHARVKNLYIGALDYKTGIFSTGVFEEIKNIFNHTVTVKFGIMGGQCSKLLQNFFQERRIEKERRGAGAVERGGLESR